MTSPFYYLFDPFSHFSPKFVHSSSLCIAFQKHDTHAWSPNQAMDNLEGNTFFLYQKQVDMLQAVNLLFSVLWMSDLIV